MEANSPLAATAQPPVPPQPPSCDGLAGVIAAHTALSHVDGHTGELILKGHRVDELAPNRHFEEVVEVFLDTQDVADRLVPHRLLPAPTLQLLEACSQAEPMEALRMAVASLSMEDLGDDIGAQPADHRTAIGLSLLAKIPTIVASHYHFSRGSCPAEPSQEPGLARDFLHQLAGSRAPTTDIAGARVRALETYLNTVSDHGMNASTFTARVIISTQSDLVSALTGAIGALKGPLHGGAPGPALDMVFKIGAAEHARNFLEAKLDKGDRLMGFGHRVYRVRDPRADVLGSAARLLATSGENRDLYELATAVEREALTLLAERKPERSLQTNVEFYTALLLHCIGLDQELFTPTFAIGRSLGWIAHCFEQLDYGRLIRPESRYIGG